MADWRQPGVNGFAFPADGEETQRTAVSAPSEVRHVLGVAFPYTDSGASHDAQLERTFLQLAYAVLRLSCSGSSVGGYFAVLRRETRDAVQQLRVRYEAGDAVHVVFASLLVQDMTRLAEAADVASREGDPAVVHSVALEIANDALRREIAVREPGVVEHTSFVSMPFGVPWNYYGRRRLLDGRPEGDNQRCPRLF
jgi:hypothetical protein